MWFAVGYFVVGMIIVTVMARWMPETKYLLSKPHVAFVLILTWPTAVMALWRGAMAAIKQDFGLSLFELLRLTVAERLLILALSVIPASLYRVQLAAALHLYYEDTRHQKGAEG